MNKTTNFVITYNTYKGRLTVSVGRHVTEEGSPSVLLGVRFYVRPTAISLKRLSTVIQAYHPETIAPYVTTEYQSHYYFVDRKVTLKDVAHV